MVDWSQLCTQQTERHLWQKHEANYGGCIFAVSALLWPAALTALLKLLLLPLPLTLSQIASFSTSALFSGFWFTRWAKIYYKNLRLAGEDRIWPGLGWFSGLMCAGSVAGAVSWGSRMHAATLLYELPLTATPQQTYYQYASTSRWYAAFDILYGLEFLCFIISKLMMLGRLAANSAGSSHAQAVDKDRASRWWGWGGGSGGLRRRALPMLFRAMAAAVVVCSVVGMVALDAAGAYDMQTAGVDEQAAAACGPAGNDTEPSLKFKNQTGDILRNAHTATSVQSVCEAVALMVTAVSYLLLVVRNVALYRRAEHVAAATLLSLADRSERISANVSDVFAESHRAGSTDAAVQIVQDTQQALVEQRRRLIAACAVVLVCFPARAGFDLLFAYSQFNAAYNPACKTCDPCQSEQYLMYKVLENTPEARPVAVAISFPLPMVLSLWLMMSSWERRHLRRGFGANKTEEEQRAVAARARMGVDLHRPVRDALHI